MKKPYLLQNKASSAGVLLPNQPFQLVRQFEQVQNADQGLSFYHTDHLGSSAWITGNNGRAEQHFTYLPFGEPWIDQQNSGFHTYFTFSGKERDMETGYGYFGARYYSSDLGIWLSVDPMSDQAPSWSPYTYCFDNPVRLIDPNGEWPWEPSNVRKARRDARNNGGHLSVYRTSMGKMATVGSNNGKEVIITAYSPTNDSWGHKMKNFFNKIDEKLKSFMTGGIHGTADNGQGQEARPGDGSNPSTDLSDFTSSIPEPFPKSGESSSADIGAEEGGGTSSEMETIGTSGRIFHDEAPSYGSLPGSYKTYKGTSDSIEKTKKLNEQGKQIYFIEIDK